MTTEPVLPGMFCWFEHASDRPTEARRFWSELLAAEAQDVPLPAGSTMSFLHRGGQTAFAVKPLDAACEVGPHWVGYVSVPDVDACLARACAAGARVLSGPDDSPIGRGAVLQDPQGAVIGVFCAAPGATDGTNPVGHGFICWCELLTPDVAASAAFCTEVLGWTCHERSMAGRTFVVAHAGPRPVATIFPRPADDAHPWTGARWLPYVQVDDVQAIGPAAAAAGARVPCPPMAIPGVGTWRPAVDPSGTEVAFMEWNRGGRI